MPHLANVQPYEWSSGAGLFPGVAPPIPPALSVARPEVQGVFRQRLNMSVTYIPRPEIEWLEQLFNFKMPEEVFRFIEVRPFLVPLLCEAHQKIKEYFDRNPSVSLEISTDPEADGEGQLFVYIHTFLSPDEALAKLDKLDWDWWLEAMDRSRGYLCIDVRLF